MPACHNTSFNANLCILSFYNKCQCATNTHHAIFDENLRFAGIVNDIKRWLPSLGQAPKLHQAPTLDLLGQGLDNGATAPPATGAKPAGHHKIIVHAALMVNKDNIVDVAEPVTVMQLSEKDLW